MQAKLVGIGAVVVLALGSSARAQEPPPAYPAPPMDSGSSTPSLYGYVPPPLRQTEPPQPYRVTRPSAVYGELLGKGLLYSVGYDYAVNEHLALGGSFSYFDPAAFFSPYVNVYPVGGLRSALMLQAGVQIVNVSRPNDELLKGLLWEDVDGVDVGGQVSIGYEFRSGFLFRVALMGIFNKNGFLPWLGLTFGGAF